MDLSIIIPTYNERKNVELMIVRIRQVMQGVQCTYEIYFVDDSRDDTPAVLHEFSAKYPEVNYFHRANTRGLGTAVLEGFKRTTGEHVIVMDADLQHPPELLPLIYHRLIQGIDVVIPSRFVEGGSDGGLNGFRRLVSWTARTIGQISIKRLREISDCTGGYFGIHRSVIHEVPLQPIGWKILMEILVKGNYETVHEVPYAFVARDGGESKMNMKEQMNYIRHIVNLVSSSPEDRRFYLFCLVGFTGIIINLLALTVLLRVFHITGIFASISASMIAMIHNFLWNNNVTWKGHYHLFLWRRILQFPQFALISGLGVAVTALIVQIALWMNWVIFIGQLIGIVVATSWNFMANNRWTWSNSTIKNEKVKVKVTQESF